SGNELRMELQPDDRTDRPTDILSRSTRRTKADSRARFDLGHVETENDCGFSLLSRLARTACPDGRTDDPISHFDSFLNFDGLNFSKAMILTLSQELGRIKCQSVNDGSVISSTVDRPSVLLLTAGHTARFDESGHK